MAQLLKYRSAVDFDYLGSRVVLFSQQVHTGGRRLAQLTNK